MSLYCYCKRSETMPYCDGSHSRPLPKPAPDEDAGDAAEAEAPESPPDAEKPAR